MKLTKYSRSEQETTQIGEQIGVQLRGGEIFILDSDLGGGKTTFTRGLVAGAGINEEVSSPSFALSHQYKNNQLNIYHYDFYRLQDAGLLTDEIREVLGDDHSIVVLEWPRNVESELNGRLVIHITIERQKSSEDHRLFILEVPDEYAYTVEQLTAEESL